MRKLMTMACAMIMAAAANASEVVTVEFGEARVNVPARVRFVQGENYGFSVAAKDSVIAKAVRCSVKDGVLRMNFGNALQPGETKYDAKKGVYYYGVNSDSPINSLMEKGLVREAGREVVTGVCEEECRALISRFVTYYTRHRPYVTLKWAESADGFIDRQREDGRPAILSSPLSAMLVHKLRAEHMAIMVGTRTALLDDPSLTVRHWYGRQPLRVVLDRKRRLPRTLHLFDGSVPTLVVTQSPPPARAKRLPGVEYLVLDYSRDILPQLMLALHSRNIQSLLVEGGRELLQSFLHSGLWDEAFVEESPLRLGSGVEAPAIDKKNFCETVQHFGRYIRHYRAQ